MYVASLLASYLDTSRCSLVVGRHRQSAVVATFGILPSTANQQPRRDDAGHTGRAQSHRGSSGRVSAIDGVLALFVPAAALDARRQQQRRRAQTRPGQALGRLLAVPRVRQGGVPQVRRAHLQGAERQVGGRRLDAAHRAPAAVRGRPAGVRRARPARWRPHARRRRHGDRGRASALVPRRAHWLVPRQPLAVAVPGAEHHSRAGTRRHRGGRG